ncbi:MAG: NAD(P)H nitroreductase [Fibrobacter sp.]|nr:NAD(P)H nitroreductase [Fibrobacter sp.]
MNPLIDLILSRRSIRKFKNKPIDEKYIHWILKAGFAAPSGKNRRTWKFTVVTNNEIIQNLAKNIGEVLSRDGYNLYNAPLLIIPSNLKESSWGLEDNTCAMQNMFLAAHSMGIGSVWINQLSQICENPQIRSILDSFEIPSTHTVHGFVALGYPLEEPKCIDRSGPVHFVR